MSQCNTTFDLKINLGHSDLYFMVKWFLFIYFLLWKKHFSFIDKARFRWAMLSCDSSYFIKNTDFIAELAAYCKELKFFM